MKILTNKPKTEHPSSAPAEPWVVSDKMAVAALACYLRRYDEFPVYTPGLSHMFTGDTFGIALAFESLREAVDGPVTTTAVFDEMMAACAEDDKGKERRAQLVKLEAAVAEMDVEAELPYVISKCQKWLSRREADRCFHAFMETRKKVATDPSPKAVKEFKQAKQDLALVLEGESPITRIDDPKNTWTALDLYNNVVDETNVLLGYGMGWACRGDIILFVGPSGIGKSTASAQQDVSWAVGREAFGIKPKRPLKILCIQGENSKDEMSRIFKSIMDGLAFTAEERQLAGSNLIYVHHNKLTGPDFLHGFVAPWLRRWRPDILRQDPLNCYLGGSPSDPEIVAPFFRNHLQCLLERYACTCITNHHTPKLTNMDTSKWRPIEYAYAACGSSELTNAPRSILVIDPTKDEKIFKFVAAKHGDRLGWRDPAGQTTCVRLFAQSREEGKILWQDPTLDDLEQLGIAQKIAKTVGRRRQFKDTGLLQPLAGKDMTFTDLLAELNGKGCDIKKTTLWDRTVEWEETGLVHLSGNELSLTDTGIRLLASVGRPVPAIQG